eukprot:Cvel_27453.t1-p1 / transcript=Cvel_27453.t1 / gene=Cvel_27453 / organism=Chromera_velia_CCMP2878 / gene_product=hypothetical protein / transcript_product=hypothetical protein / location=Cvel_scaffold3428:504-4335(-) / protein_length=544 / sequence_SO=supercontig / SO=protein_coding / is_pseudo=false
MLKAFKIDEHQKNVFLESLKERSTNLARVTEKNKEIDKMAAQLKTMEEESKKKRERQEKLERAATSEAKKRERLRHQCQQSHDVNKDLQTKLLAATKLREEREAQLKSLQLELGTLTQQQTEIAGVTEGYRKELAGFRKATAQRAASDRRKKKRDYWEKKRNEWNWQCAQLVHRAGQLQSLQHQEAERFLPTFSGSGGGGDGGVKGPAPSGGDGPIPAASAISPTSSATETKLVELKAASAIQALEFLEKGRIVSAKEAKELASVAVEEGEGEGSSHPPMQGAPPTWMSVQVAVDELLQSLGTVQGPAEDAKVPPTKSLLVRAARRRLLDVKSRMKRMETQKRISEARAKRLHCLREELGRLEKQLAPLPKELQVIADRLPLRLRGKLSAYRLLLQTHNKFRSQFADPLLSMKGAPTPSDLLKISGLRVTLESEGGEFVLAAVPPEAQAQEESKEKAEKATEAEASSSARPLIPLVPGSVSGGGSSLVSPPSGPSAAAATSAEKEKDSRDKKGGTLNGKGGKAIGLRAEFDPRTSGSSILTLIE